MTDTRKMDMTLREKRSLYFFKPCASLVTLSDYPMNFLFRFAASSMRADAGSRRGLKKDKAVSVRVRLFRFPVPMPLYRATE